MDRSDLTASLLLQRLHAVGIDDVLEVDPSAGTKTTTPLIRLTPLVVAGAKRSLGERQGRVRHGQRVARRARQQRLHGRIQRLRHVFCLSQIGWFTLAQLHDSDLERCQLQPRQIVDLRLPRDAGKQHACLRMRQRERKCLR